MDSGQTIGVRLGLEDPTLCLIITSSVIILAAAQKGKRFHSFCSQSAMKTNHPLALATKISAAKSLSCLPASPLPGSEVPPLHYWRIIEVESVGPYCFHNTSFSLIHFVWRMFT